MADYKDQKPSPVVEQMRQRSRRYDKLNECLENVVPNIGMRYNLIQDIEHIFQEGGEPAHHTDEYNELKQDVTNLRNELAEMRKQRENGYNTLALQLDQAQKRLTQLELAYMRSQQPSTYVLDKLIVH